jgi:hypothetical protein
MRRVAPFLCLMLAGCSNAPLAGFLDWVQPSRIPPEPVPIVPSLPSPIPIAPAPQAPAPGWAPPPAAPGWAPPPPSTPNLPPISTPPRGAT